MLPVRRRSAPGVRLVLQEPLGVHRRLAALTRRGHRLTIDRVGDVAGGEHTGHARLGRGLLDHDVAGLRQLELSLEDTGTQVSEGEIASLRYYRDIRYVAEDRDLKIFGRLGGQDAQDKFLKVFWQKLDPTPDTAINERLIEHIRRMRFAESNFSGGHGQTGIDSDKGRIYVQYGPPSDKEYRSAVDSPKPYEIWTYEQRGTYEFVFRDRRGIGVYELVHSTYPGELFNPNWQSEI